MNRKEIIKKVFIVFTIIFLSIFIYYKFDLKNLKPEVFSARIRTMGKTASLFYILILTFLPLLLFPDSIIVIAGGMVFGVFWGTILTSIGSLIGAILSYYIAGYLGHDFIKKFIKKSPIILDSDMSGFILILIFRLIPLFPFKLVSYSAGLVKVDIKEFTIATFIGSIPGILIYVNLGDKINDIGTGKFYIAISIIIVFSIFLYFLRKDLTNIMILKNQNQQRWRRYDFNYNSCFK